LVRIAVRRLFVSALLVLVLMPFGVSSALAISSPPTWDGKTERKSFVDANPVLTRFTLEIDGVTPTLATLDGFKAWYAADPAAVVAFLSFLNANPAVASQVYAWIAAKPGVAAQLFIALSQKWVIDWRKTVLDG
jgi:hypothetical protein